MTATNDAYTAHNDATFGVPGARGLLVNDSDTQHRAITLDQLDGNGGPLPLHGTSAKGATVVVHADGAFSYDARGVAAIQALPRGQTTSDTFSYRITDGLGATDSATVTMTVLGTRNHSPVTQGDTATISSTVPLHGANVLSNDSDPDGDTLAVTQLNGTSSLRGTSSDGAAVTIDPHGSFTYDPTGSTTLKALPDGGHMTDSFTYTVDDGHGGTSSATVSITVTGVNDPPVAVNDGSTATPVASTTSDTPLTSQPTLFVNDSDPDTGDTFTLNSASVTSAKGASVTVNSDGTWTYDPSGSSTLRALTRGTSTTDTFTYTVKDSTGAVSGTATVTVGVTGVNHPPVVSADSASTQADTPLTVAAPGVLGNDTDADGDSPTVTMLNGSTTLTGTSADGAAVTIHADGSYTYDPTGSVTLKDLGAGAQTTDTFNYTADDGHGGTGTATVSITVTGVNDAPLANPDTYSTSVDVTLNDGSSVLTNDTDADGDSLTAILVTGPSNASAFTLNPNGTFSYTPTGRIHRG